MERGQVCLTGKDGMLDVVEAEIFGHLAVHPAYQGEGYTITHIPTGCSIGKASKHLEHKTAIMIAKELMDLEGWDTTDRDWLVEFMTPQVREVTRGKYGLTKKA